MSQTGVDQNLIKYAKTAKSYIEDLERKIWYLEQLQSRTCGSPDTLKLAAEIEELVARPERPHTVSSDAPIGAWDGEAPEWEEGETPQAWDWTEEEQQEWEAWQAEKARGPGNYRDEDTDWEEDAQPPSEELRMAARCRSAEHLPEPASSAHAHNPAPAVDVSSSDNLGRVNSVTHRAEYMRLATWLLICHVA